MKLPKYSIIFVIILIIAGFFLTMHFLGSEQGMYDGFATGLAESGAKMYGAWWCPHCNEQKQMFGKSWEIIKDEGVYIECANADRSFNEVCKSQGIDSVPVWKFPDGSELRGRQSFYALAEKTGCELDTISEQ